MRLFGPYTFTNYHPLWSWPRKDENTDLYKKLKNTAQLLKHFPLDFFSESDLKSFFLENTLYT